MSRILLVSRKIAKIFLWTLGSIFLVMLILSFTDIPYYAYYNLGPKQKELSGNPDYIVMLGGSGMPSPDGFMRTFYAADAALKFKKATIILAHPKNQFDKDTFYQLNLMRHEFAIRGVDSTRIKFEPDGFNTRSQAQNVARLIPNSANAKILLITSPEHMFRAIKTFKKLNFSEVSGSSAFANDLAEEDVEDDEDSDEMRVKNSSLRYNIWTYLQYQIIVLREYTAIAYYWLKGWI